MGKKVITAPGGSSKTSGNVHRPQSGDYAASDVTNDSTVTGATVKDALQAVAGAAGVASFNLRTGAVVPVAGDYAASLVTNDSAVAGAHVSDALNALAAAILAVGKPTTSNKNMAASVTTGDFQLACATAIASTPSGGGYVAIALNGVLQAVGNGVRTSPIYFSGDGGVTARAYGAVVAGDLPYWVGTVAHFELTTSDRFDYFYNAP